MAIFETLTLLFKVDSSQLKKEIDDVKKKTGETAESFKDVDEQTKKTDNQFLALSKTLATVAATYFTAASVIGGFKSSIANTTDLGRFSRELDIDVETLSVWSNAIKNAGGDAAAFQNSLKSLATTFNSSGEVALAYFPELANIFQKLGPTQAQIYGQQTLGLDPDTITFLLQGRKAVEEALSRAKELGPTTEEDVKTAESFNKSVGELNDAFGKLSRTILTEILPPLTDFINVITDVVSAFTTEKPTHSETPSFLQILFPEAFPFKPKTPGATGITKEEYEAYGESTTFNEEQKPLPPISGSSHNRAYELPANYSEIYKVPTVIPQVSNSQARSLYIGDININSSSENAKEIANEVVGQIDKRSELLNQLQQSNSYFDNAVVI
jgi:hypothetical protein